VEFTSALAGVVPIRAFSPRISPFGRFERHRGCTITCGSCEAIEFPVQRGYFSSLLSGLCFEDARILDLVSNPGVGVQDPLICCFPHYARVAELWPGPVIYYATDLFRAYSGWDSNHISALERRICGKATLVCPNSSRIADILVRDSGCDRSRIHVLPNAVRKENLLPAPSLSPTSLPRDVEDLPRPVAGVIGNLAENTDWELLDQTVQKTPWLSWLFVGPYTDAIADSKQADARKRLLQNGGRVRFSGPKEYADLKNYARSFDVAVLPYRKREPTYSGSSTRFYEHLAACRPIIATDGFEELLHKTPALAIVRSSEEMLRNLEALRSSSFEDDQAELRWRTSYQNTWEDRAKSMCHMLKQAVDQTLQGAY
jgi:glycosyltransferase involved in cell wall biosynthesis